MADRFLLGRAHTLPVMISKDSREEKKKERREGEKASPCSSV